MIKIAMLGLGLVIAGYAAASAQDVVGIEDCTKAAGLNKRTGCLQSNVNFLQQLITKNASEARQRLNAATTEIVALKSEVASLKLIDIDWRAGEIAVCGKGGRKDRLPLPADVGEAIAGYCRRGRADDITGHLGTALQVRPKGRDAADMRAGYDAAGRPTRVGKCGFYLRPTFVARILADGGGG